MKTRKRIRRERTTERCDRRSVSDRRLNLLMRISKEVKLYSSAERHPLLDDGLKLMNKLFNQRVKNNVAERLVVDFTAQCSSIATKLSEETT